MLFTAAQVLADAREAHGKLHTLLDRLAQGDLFLDLMSSDYADWCELLRCSGRPAPPPYCTVHGHTETPGAERMCGTCTTSGREPVSAIVCAVCGQVKRESWGEPDTAHGCGAV